MPSEKLRTYISPFSANSPELRDRVLVDSTVIQERGFSAGLRRDHEKKNCLIGHCGRCELSLWKRMGWSAG